jgi:hypothetical protein
LSIRFAYFVQQGIHHSLYASTESFLVGMNSMKKLMYVSLGVGGGGGNYPDPALQPGGGDAGGGGGGMLYYVIRY